MLTVGEGGVTVRSPCCLHSSTVNLKLLSNKKLIRLKVQKEKGFSPVLFFEGKSKFNVYSKDQLTELCGVSESPKACLLKLLTSLT